MRHRLSVSVLFGVCKTFLSLCNRNWYFRVSKTDSFQWNCSLSRNQLHLASSSIVHILMYAASLVPASSPCLFSWQLVSICVFTEIRNKDICVQLLMVLSKHAKLDMICPICCLFTGLIYIFMAFICNLWIHFPLESAQFDCCAFWKHLTETFANQVPKMCNAEIKFNLQIKFNIYFSTSHQMNELNLNYKYTSINVSNDYPECAWDANAKKLCFTW